jgi:hypothetical protein
MATPEQTAAKNEMADALKGSEDQNRAANTAAADAARDLRAGNGAQAALDADAAQKAADGALDQYRAVQLIYKNKKHLFAESGPDQEALEAEVLRAYELALQAQDDADRAKLDSLKAQGTPKAVTDVAEDVLTKRKAARKKFLEADREAAAAEGFADEASRERKKGGTPTDKAKHEEEAQRLEKKAGDAAQRKFSATADARQLEHEARDLEGSPPTFAPFKH